MSQETAISLLTTFFAEQKKRTKQKARDREREREKERKNEREMKEPDYCLEYLDKHWTLSKKIWRQNCSGSHCESIEMD